MYPQFVDSQRGMADIRPRQPFPGYYGHKMPGELPYGGMAAPPRPPIPYAGKPEAMASHEAMYAPSWNPSMSMQGYGGKPSLGKPDYAYMGQVRARSVFACKYKRREKSRK